MSGSVSNYSCLTIQVIYIWRFVSTGLKSPLGFRPLTEPPSSSLVLGFKDNHRYNPAPPGRVIPNSYIPNTVPDKGFEKLLEILKKKLPKDNELPDSTYAAKKVVCPLGLEVQKIHACPNDCILDTSPMYL